MKDSKFLKIIFSLSFCFLLFVVCGCTNKEPIYSEAMKMVDNGEYKEASIKFEELDDYKDSKKALAYCNAMEFVEKGKSKEIKVLYDNFKDADDFRDAHEYAKMLEGYVKKFPGKYRAFLRRGVCFLNIDENLKAVHFYDTPEQERTLDLHCKINKHYRVISELTLEDGFDEGYGKQFVNPIEVDENFDNITVTWKFKDRDSTDYYQRISEEEYAKDIEREINKEKMQEIIDEIDSYPVVSTEEAVNLLVGKTVVADYLNGTIEYSFKEDGTLNIKEGEQINDEVWKVTDNVIYEYIGNKPFRAYEIRKYKDGKMLLCRYNVNNDIFTVFKIKNKEIGYKKVKPIKKEYFHECEELLTPDSIDKRFAYDSTKVNDGIVIHKYTIDAKNKEDASKILEKYYDFIALDDSLRESYGWQRDQNGGFILTLHDRPYSSMIGGTDKAESGEKYILTCGFKEKKD